MNSGKKNFFRFYILYDKIRPGPGDPSLFHDYPCIASHLSAQLNWIWKVEMLALNFFFFSIMFFFRFAPCVVSSCFHPLKFQRYYIFSAVCCWVETRSEMCSSPRMRWGKKKCWNFSTTEPYDEWFRVWCLYLLNRRWEGKNYCSSRVQRRPLMNTLN